MRASWLFLLVFLSISACSTVTPIPQIPSRITANPVPTATEDPADYFHQKADVKLSDNGKTFTFGVTTRFSVFLDDEKYPVGELTCAPAGIIGYVSNGSLRGPDLYPIMFEAVLLGQCTLSDRDFSVHIVVK